MQTVNSRIEILQVQTDFKFDKQTTTIQSERGKYLVRRVKYQIQLSDTFKWISSLNFFPPN